MVKLRNLYIYSKNVKDVTFVTSIFYNNKVIRFRVSYNPVYINYLKLVIHSSTLE